MVSPIMVHRLQQMPYVAPASPTPASPGSYCTLLVSQSRQCFCLPCVARLFFHGSSCRSSVPGISRRLWPTLHPVVAVPGDPGNHHGQSGVPTSRASLVLTPIQSSTPWVSAVSSDRSTTPGTASLAPFLVLRILRSSASGNGNRLIRSIFSAITTSPGCSSPSSATAPGGQPGHRKPFPGRCHSNVKPGGLRILNNPLLATKVLGFGTDAKIETSNFHNGRSIEVYANEPIIELVANKSLGSSNWPPGYWLPKLPA